MDYREQLNRFRDRLHSDLVVTATVKNCVYGNDSDGILELNIPYKFKFFKDDNTYDDLFVIGIDCESGNLVVEKSDGYSKYIRYHHLSVEDLLELHLYVVQQKQFKFKHYYETC